MTETEKTQRMRESLSAVMDGEANELELERVLRNIGSDTDLRAAWCRYNAARGCMSGERQAHLEIDISQRVRASLEAGSAAARQGLRQRLLRPVASFAVAATVAATAVIGGQQFARLGAEDSGAGEPAVAVSVPWTYGTVPGAVPTYANHGINEAPTLQYTTRTAYRELARQRMGKYLQQHAEHAALNSPQGLIPFARVQTISE